MGPLDHSSCYRITPTLGAATSTFASFALYHCLLSNSGLLREDLVYTER